MKRVPLKEGVLVIGKHSCGLRKRVVALPEFGQREGSQRLPPLAALRHRFGFAAGNLSTDTVEDRHSRAARREVLREIEVPVASIPFRKPGNEPRLLFRRKILNRLLNLVQAHIS
jgi:hypothetical protein